MAIKGEASFALANIYLEKAELKTEIYIQI